MQTLNTVTYTVNSQVKTYYYYDVPTGMVTINNGNLIADTLTGNTPFRSNGQKQKAWLSYRPVNITDTFAVSTSWLKPTGSADAWLVTPTINNIAANTVLTWEAVAPDISNSDGYEVYVTTNVSSTPIIGDFSTNNRLFATIAESNNWVTHGISLAAYAGQSIRIAFRNNTTNQYQLWIDDIIIKNISNTYDVAGISNDTYKYSTINTNNTIKASFKNNGSMPITSLVLNYQVGTGQIFSETQTLSTPLNYLDSKQFTFAQLYISGTTAYNIVKAWVSTINGQTDQLNSNDTVNVGLTLSTALPEKKVLVEEFTSAKCGNCPDDYIRLRDAALTNTNVISTSVHSNDNLTNTSGATLTSNYTTIVPSVVVDRYYYSAANDWQSLIAQRQSMAVPVEVAVSNVTYNIAARQISATVVANFLGDVKGDYRINLLIKENNVYGPLNDLSDNGWNQYNGSFNLQASPFYQLGIYYNASTYLLRANDYSHNFVINEYLDGPYGASGIIPINGGTAGQSYSKTYTYTLPFTFGGEYRFNPDNIYLVGVVSENINSHNVLNAKEVKLTSSSEIPVGLMENNIQALNVQVYPNPASTECYLKYTIPQSELVILEIYNAIGEVVLTKSEFVNQGEVTQRLHCANLAEGNYIIKLSYHKNSIHQKLTIIK